GLVEPGAGAERADQLRGRDRAGLDVGREADAQQPALLSGRLLLGAKLLVVEHLQTAVEREAVVAAVVRHRDQGLVGARELRDEVLPAALGDVHVYGARARLRR